MWESLEADELDYHIGQYERNSDEVIPWEQVRAALFKEAVTLPVAWIPEADADLKEALE